jgi:molybdopterin/thiamine biosynthesis adenylyltransferase|tara:strand:+ start:971 stop:1981 length:1011 start_codon:yes stop_codon:yes gene_type:complete
MTTKLKIKDTLYVLRDSEDNYVFISTATRRIKKFQVDYLVKDIIRSLDSEQTEQDLTERLSSKYNSSDIDNCLNALEQEGILRRYETDLEKGRHYRQLLFLDELTNSREETLELQKRLENSKIAVFGVGGIGTWIVNGLNQIGVGEIRITDPDVVDESNLNRQLYFDSSDIGKYKVDVVKGKLNDANIISFKKRVEPNTNLEEIVSGCNFLVNCADSPSVSETTRIIDKYATQLEIAYCVSGGYNLHLGMIGPIIIPGITKTFDDFLEYQKKMDPLKDLEKIRDIRQTGNLGPIAGAVANIQTMEIFKYLTGKGRINLNRFAEIDFMDLGIEWREF